jgi:hypothetical protein
MDATSRKHLEDIIRQYGLIATMDAIADVCRNRADEIVATAGRDCDHIAAGWLRSAAAIEVALGGHATPAAAPGG